MAVDGEGNIYVADAYNGTTGGVVSVMSPGCDSSICVTALGGNFYFQVPVGIAVDKIGNVYVSEGAGYGVDEMTPGCFSSACVTNINDVLASHAGVAVDASGSVYVTGAFDPGVNEIYPGCASRNSGGYCVTLAAVVPDSPQGIAVDGAGNLFLTDSQGVEEIVRGLGSASVGSSSTSIPVTFYFTSGSSGVRVSVTTQGVTGQDFTDAGTGSCDTNGTGYDYQSGNTCTVQVIFKPKAAGPRYGAVQLLDASGSVIAVANIDGTGVGPQLVFGPSAPPITLPVGRPAYGVAVDAGGNLFVAADPGFNPEDGTPADWYEDLIYEVPYGCTSSSCVEAFGGGFIDPTGVALDGAGNIYVADPSAPAVLQMPPGCGSASCVRPLGGGFTAPNSVAVDWTGNVWVLDGNALKEMPPDCNSANCVTVRGGGFSSPGGLAVDGNGNVYIADTGNKAVKEIPGGCLSSSCVTTLGGGFSSPSSVALDGGGNIYISDGGIKQMPPGCASSSCVITLSSTFAGDLAVDGSGNLYNSATSPYGEGTTVELPFATAPSLTFAGTAVGSQSSNSPQALTLRNIGNAPLTFPAPTTGENPSVSTNFALDASTTCPEVLSSSSTAALAPGVSCNLAIDFVPTTTGVLTGSATLTDNSGNASYAMQSISLSGDGDVMNPVQPAVTVTPSSYLLTTAQTLNINVTVSGGSGNPTATGTVTLYRSDYWWGSQTLSGGSTIFSFPLAAGTYPFTVTYTPDVNSSWIYTDATGTAPEPVTVVKPIGSCTNPNPNPNPNPTSFANPGDFNGDCKSDILWQNSSAGQLYEWLMNGTSTLNQLSPGGASSPWGIVGIGDFNGDGKSDILWQNSSTGQLYIWLMNGASITSQVSPGTVPAPWKLVGVGDFGGTGESAPLWQNNSTGQVFIGFFDGTPFGPAVWTVASPWKVIGIGDFNGDGKADILWQNSSTGQLYVWLMNGYTITAQLSPGTVAAPWEVVGIGDFDGDGKSDILWRNSTTGQLYTWFMNGASITSQLTPGTVGTAWNIYGIGDYNGDGKADILWQNTSTGQLYIWLMNGVSITTQQSPGTVSPPWQVVEDSP